MELKLNAILKEEAKSKIIEVKRSTFHGGKPAGTETDLYIGRTRVTVRQGVVQSEIPMEGPISEEIKGFIVGVRAEVMIHEDLLGITRAKGKYALPDDDDNDDFKTTGVVEFYMKGTINVSCYGPTREKTLALHELIRDGNIRPSNEWDRVQIVDGPDRLQQTLELLRSATAEKARLTRELEKTQGCFEHAWEELLQRRQEVKDFSILKARIQAVYELAVRLNDRLWPFCTKGHVSDQITLALNDGEKT